MKQPNETSRQKKQPVPGNKCLSYLANIPGNIKLIGVAVILVLFIFAFPIICQFSGKSLGNAVGVAVGTFKAVTEEIPQAYTEGKEAGLSAEDTTVKISEKTREIGKLDVLVANTSIANNHKVGDKYQALYSTQAKVVFSVDVTQAIVTMNPGEKVVSIALPAVTPDIYINDTSTQQIAEWTRAVFNGNAKDGFIGYMNSRDKLEENAIDTISNYDKYVVHAEEAATKQISSLVQSIVGQEYTIIVNFQ